MIIFWPVKYLWYGPLLKEIKYDIKYDIRNYVKSI